MGWAGSWQLVQLEAHEAAGDGWAETTKENWLLKICRNRSDSAYNRKGEKQQINLKEGVSCPGRLPESFALR